ncbi:uncharacterized protein EI97DRAFT_462101 [Westerdykella ornata]|uniref:Uncharacterized protein n=1 Tax=Westerdykella ornata TaxID=318751 RepID=A0A6A6J8I7_WESOR|nr:uncharacterized protein EI97DRAFT_462101 [Westerdykella ornata]KAF2272318.1 hypothetical protein EI97DRAFT_462101 [Westerdykella ornata]
MGKKNKKPLKAKASKLFKGQGDSPDTPPHPPAQFSERETQFESQVKAPVKSSTEDEFDTFATESDTEDNVTSNISVGKASPKGKMKKKSSLFLRLRSNTASGSGSAPPLPPPPVPPFPFPISAPILQDNKPKVPPPRPPRPTDPRQLPFCIGVETSDGGFAPLNRYVTPPSHNSPGGQPVPGSPSPFQLSISSIPTTPILQPDQMAQLPGTVTPSATMPEPLSALQNYRTSAGSTMSGSTAPGDHEDFSGAGKGKSAIRSPPVSMYAAGNLRDRLDARRALTAGLPADFGKKGKMDTEMEASGSQNNAVFYEHANSLSALAANNIPPQGGQYPFSWQLPNMERVVPPGSGGPEFHFVQQKGAVGGAGDGRRGSGGSAGGAAPPGTLWKDEKGFLHFVPDI